MFRILLVCLLLSGAVYARYVKVFYAESFKSEGSEIQPYADFVLLTNKNKYTLGELYKDGWELKNVIKTNLDSKSIKLMIFMDISDKDYRKVDTKYN